MTTEASDSANGDTVLAVYGSLAPGESGHQVLAGLEGRWEPATVRGHRFVNMWQTYTGFPGFIADPTADEVPVQLFHSADLTEEAWSELDAYEGPGYERRRITAVTNDGMPVETSVYEVRLATENSLALYGSLRPGGTEHHTVSHLLGDGYWFEGRVRGYDYEITWGPAEGFDGITLHEDGNLVEVSVLLSSELERRWGRLDHQVGGDGYLRRGTVVLSSDGSRAMGVSSIYETVADAD